MSKSRPSSKAGLPREEWNFHEISDHEMKLAFLYEYGRRSKMISSSVQSVRANRSAVVSWLLPVVRWLARIPEFPKMPWIRIKEQKRRWSPILAHRLTEPWAVGLCDVFDENVPTDGMLFGEAGIEYRFAARAIKTEPHESILVLQVNWKAPDASIINGLKQFISDCRPEELRHLAKAARQQVIYDGLNLPFRPVTALGWLGVLRRREAVKSWKEYVRLYPAQSGKDSLKTESVMRARKEDCRQAKVILRWFEEGRQFQPNDFK
jgi:hypothetical protein